MQSIELEEYRTLGKPISEGDAGSRLDLHLGRSFPFLSRAKWRKRLLDNQVVVNGAPKKPTYRLKEGDQIRYFHPQSSEPKVDRGIYAVWAHAGIMAVYKPSNLPMHEGGRYRYHTFAEVVKEVFGKEWAAVHRLDRDTSGIVLCANTKELRNSLAKELRERTLSKTYLAIGRGTKPRQETWLETGSIGFTEETLLREKRWVVEEGLPSATEFSVLDSSSRGGFHLLKASPKTGRTHQIRIHAAYNGLPLVGETKYHPDERVFLDYIDNGFTAFVKEAISRTRLCLHATEVKFRHPRDEKIYTVSCPIPADMVEIWESLLRSDR